MSELDHNVVMREFAGIGERLARLETNLGNITATLSAKSSESELRTLSQRVQVVELDLASVKTLLAQYRGALVVLGIIWPFVASWLQKRILGG